MYDVLIIKEILHLYVPTLTVDKLFYSQVFVGHTIAHSIQIL